MEYEQIPSRIVQELVPGKSDLLKGRRRRASVGDWKKCQKACKMNGYNTKTS